MVMVTIMKGKCWQIGGTFGMARASFFALISKNAPTMNTMASGSRICEMERAIATITMRICMLVSGKLIVVMVWENFSIESKIGTKATGKMI